MNELIIQNNTEYKVKLKLDSGGISTVAPRYDIQGFQIKLKVPDNFDGTSIVIESIE
ncbi:hypothetical protein O1D87_003409 [Vibrio cholerae]|uniref:hypothetical protein n=1 Tax=Vibrio cholerae TaxID=666 RepID=UPI0012B9A52A|nr:hypothetical protein [Vibrio cholerae]EJL6293429.1 hypothetical protein [Vibrio cholerae]EKG0039163.1 hypothetical protein [Vibrio cholerae]ELE1940718.1 hypothetical protein [Vibrio cholerae]GIB39290.1 hypothetical protein VCSRO44_3494 [Vibrio cholerae]